ncbi:hypothetical protein M758_9G092800 [Ceratodon purpureus]|nr:hypothetical protein M758_9G092800 [Ceratodon purpureus]
MDPRVVYFKSDRPASKSAFFIKWINTLAVLLSLVIIGLGIWLATRPGDCEKYLTAPVFFVGAFFLLVAILGLFGSWCALVPVLYAYLFLMFLVLLTFLIVTIFIFVVTTPGGGYRVNGQMFLEYKLNSYSKYVQDKLSKQSNWNHVKACIAGTNNCANFNNILPNAYLSTNLNPIQSGCCRPPSECRYPMISFGTFDTSSNNLSSTSNLDCPKFSNNVTVRCYECDSCRGGVAQELKQTGRVAGIISLIIFLILIIVYSVACCASQNATWEHYGRV